MKSELSWKSVLIIAMLLATGITMRVFGDVSLASTLFGGVLGFVAQGFGYRRQSDGAATPEQILPEQSNRNPFKLPPVTTLLFSSVGLAWFLFLR